VYALDDLPTVSLRGLLSGAREAVQGTTDVQVAAYTEEIVRSGFPGIRPLTDRPRRAQLAGYLDRIVERADHRVLAIEVKLASFVTDDDVKHLLWLRSEIGGDLVDAAVICTGTEAYRRQDGIAVIPAALLGP